MATIQKARVYYIGTYEGIGKTSGKPYKQVKILVYSEHFKSWNIEPMFVDKLPDICKDLKSGDLIKIELQQSATQKPVLIGIAKKLADSPLLINP